MRRPRLARRGNGERRSIWPDLRTWLRIALAVFTWGALCTLLLGYNLFPGRVWLRLGAVSPVDVRAPATTQYVDLDETRALREQAEQQVPMQYSRMPFAVEDAQRHADDVFEALTRQRAHQTLTPEQERSLRGLPADARAWAGQATPKDLEDLDKRAKQALLRVMSREIREGTPDVRAAADEAVGLAGDPSLDPSAGALLAIVVRRAVGPTHRYDKEATEAARVEARQRVTDVVRTIEANHRIITKGERVTSAHLAMLRAVGLTGPRVDYSRFVALALIAWLLVVLFGAQTRHWAPQIYRSPALLFLLSLLLTVPVLTGNLLVLALPNVWMLVVPAAALMAAVLLAERVGLLLAVGLSALAGLSTSGGLPAAVLALGSSLAGLTYLSHIWPPSRLRWIVGAMSVTNVALLVSVGLLQGQSPLAPGGMRDLAFGALLYSPLATALAVGGILVLQRPFGITTHLGLLELSNPQHPLLKRLQAEAPGTYFACVTVANLADAAAEAVGADSLLARVGALYHDLGKLTRPPFFVENQALLGTDNMHDNLSSSLSGLIIMSHVKDGVELARRERLPQEVVDIIEQHHGTTLVSFFYHRALTGDRPESVSEEHFRYPGPLPRTKEAALVMLADSVQAAVKSIADPTPQRVQQMVRDVVRDRVVGGQLAECDLTFRDVVAVEATMSRLLTALLCHGRIEYPEQVSTGLGG